MTIMQLLSITSTKLSIEMDRAYFRVLASIMEYVSDQYDTLNPVCFDDYSQETLQVISDDFMEMTDELIRHQLIVEQRYINPKEHGEANT